MDDRVNAGGGTERADSYDREDGTPFKRKRLTLACLPCKRRKAKCSKTRPCTTCVLRDEGDRCEYDDGTAITPSQQLVTWDHFLSLQNRLERIENILEMPDEPSGGGSAAGGHESARQRDAHGNINGLENRTSDSLGDSRDRPHAKRLDDLPSQNNFIKRYHRLNEIEDAANTLEELAVAGTAARSPTEVRPEETAKESYGDPGAQPYPYAPYSYAPQGPEDHDRPRSHEHPQLMLYDQGRRTNSSDHESRPPGHPSFSSADFSQHGPNGKHFPGAGPLHLSSDDLALAPTASRTRPVWPSIACPPDSFKKGDARWMRDMNEVLQAIPGDRVIVPLVNEFFLEARRSWHPLHEILVREEFRQFLTHRSNPGFTFDPAWLALFCSMLCTSAIDIQDNPASFSASPIELQRMDLSKLSKDLLAASDTALLCSNYMMRPQMRVLYTYLVRVSRSVDLEMMAGVVPGAYQTTIVGTMAGICKLLNLDQLGSDPLKMPDDDPMLPPGSSTLKRQLACQAFNAVFFYDTFSEFRQFLNRNDLSYAFVAGSYTTEASQNFKETMDVTSIVPPRPLTEYTENTWEVHKHRLAIHWRRTSQNLAVGFGNKTYETLLARDAELREEHRELLDIKFVGINPDDTSLGVMDCGYHQRFLNLHRPFLIRSYREPRYIYSQRSCVESSFRITSLHRELYSRPGLKAWYLYRHHLSAITVLFIHALHTPYEVSRVKTELRMSLELFEKSKVCKLPSIVRAAGRGDRIILAMLQMLESPERSAKSIEHIMKDVVRNVSTPKAIKSNAPSTSTSNPASQGPSPEAQADAVNPVAQMFMFDDTALILQAFETSQNADEMSGWIPARLDPTIPYETDQDLLASMLNWHAAGSYPVGPLEPSVFNQSTF